MFDIAHERVVKDDDEHPVGPEGLRILKVEIGEAVKADGGLSATRAALDDDEPARRLRDELELLGVDERRDLGEAFILASVAFADAERAGLMKIFWPCRRALAALERIGARRRLGPLAIAPLHEDALRRLDALEHAALDRERALHEHLALDLARAEFLLIFIALFVAIIDSAHGRVAPIDDAHAGLRVEVGAPSDEDLAELIVLFEDHAPKIRRACVDDAFDDL